MYRNTRSPSGTSVWVCDPQSVGMKSTSDGFAGSLMSNTWIPSKVPGVEALELVLAQFADDCGVSTDRNSKSPYTDRSPCAPLHAKSTTSFGLAGALMSKMRNPR